MKTWNAVRRNIPFALPKWRQRWASKEWTFSALLVKMNACQKGGFELEGRKKKEKGKNEMNSYIAEKITGTLHKSMY